MSLPTIKTSAAPVPMNQGLDTLVRRVTNALEAVPGQYRHMALSDRSAPSADERKALEVRAAELDMALAPADENVIVRAVAALKAVFPSPAADADQTRLAAKLYASALSKFPAWAVSEACRRFLEGHAGSGTFAPTPAELANECREIIGPWLTERGSLLKILTAEIYHAPTDEEREASTARLKAILHWEQDVKPKLRPKTEQPKESPEQALERLAAEATRPLAISEHLAKKLGGRKLKHPIGESAHATDQANNTKP